MNEPHANYVAAYRELIGLATGGSSDEALRERAYFQGRAALAAGIGPVELASIHHELLADLLSPHSTKENLVPTMEYAAIILNEALAPYEMALRGYQESNSALTRAVSEARATAHELDTFAYSVSHDLRAPLRAIDGFSMTLVDEYGDALDERGRDRLTRIRTAAQHMAALIDGLLSISRATRAPMQPRPVDLTAIVRELAEELAAEHPSRVVDWRIEDGVSAFGDPALLRALLQNLLSNSWKFTARRDPAVIVFGARDDGDERALFMQDNGAGFDMANRDRLFTAFQRLHPATEFEGTGIGLATVQRIVNRHGGRVWVEAEVDHGATFYWTLPAFPAE